MKSINKYLGIAIRAALDAGVEIINVYDSDDFNIELKGDDSPLTRADKISNDIINSFLIPTGIPIISEENRQTDFEVRRHWNQCWIVDPVDGTKEFIKRNGEFTVNISFVKNGKPILGVIYVPDSKTLYYADVELGKSFKAQLKSHQCTLEDIKMVSEELVGNSCEADFIKVVGSRSHMNQETLNYVESLKSSGRRVEIVSIGSSLKFCLIAEGEAAVYPRFAPTMEWDTAAGQAICNAIGVDVISNATGKTLRYNKENLLNPGFLVAK